MVLDWCFAPFYQEADTGAGSASAAGDSGAEGGGEGGAGEGDQHTVPFTRFDEVNREKNAAELKQAELETQNQRLREQLDAVNSAAVDGGGEGDGSGRAAAGGNLPAAPEGMDRLQAVYWYIRQGLERDLPQVLPGALAKVFGAPVEQVKATIERAGHATDYSAEMQYRELCKDVGVDASNPVLRSAFKGMLAETEGAQPRAVLESIKKTLNLPTPTAEARTGTAITGGVESHASVERIMPRDKEHATDLALKGKRVPEFGVLDVFADRANRRRGAK